MNFCGAIEYYPWSGISVHSDFCFNNNAAHTAEKSSGLKPDDNLIQLLHKCLNEWVDNSNLTGAFWLSGLVRDFTIADTPVNSSLSEAWEKDDVINGKVKYTCHDTGLVVHDDISYAPEHDMILIKEGELFPVDPEVRSYWHTTLDEWLSKSYGTGYFWIGNRSFLRAQVDGD